LSRVTRDSKSIPSQDVPQDFQACAIALKTKDAINNNSTGSCEILSGKT